VEVIFRRLEAWGYPAAGLAWLRRRRLLVIIILAILSWICFLALFLAAYAVGTQVFLLFNGAGAAAAPV
tara:strand:+ start:4997 stop:5203 length:207 start_codon:yes stop_codon:yes gene_type:complete